MARESRSMTRSFVSAVVAMALAATASFAAGPDVPFVPTPQVVLDEMLRMANVGPADLVYDLGSGDGRIVITAAKKFGARAVGVEFDPELIAESEENARVTGVTDRVTFVRQDFFKTDFSKATVVAMYLLPNVMGRFRAQMLELRPGTRLVAHDFDFGDWKPDQKTSIRKNVFLWIVPAKVAGKWRVRAVLPGGDHAFDLELRQKYQEVDGYARFAGVAGAGLWEPKLEGDRIRFVVVDNRDRDNEATLYFAGHVSGNTMSGDGTRGVGNEQAKFEWSATRQ
jgi:precorrin-6B methylase 2